MGTHSNKGVTNMTKSNKLSKVNTKRLTEIKTSYDLFGMLNRFRVEAGEKPYRKHSDLVVKIRKELDDDLVGHEIVTAKLNNNNSNNTVDAFKLTRKEVFVVSMRESKFVRSAMYDYVEELEKQRDLLLNVVYEVVNGKAFLGQEFGCKCADIKKPRKLIQFLKEDEVAFAVLQEKGLFTYRQVGKKNTDRVWTWSRNGFKWLVNNRDRLNSKVEELIIIEQAKKDSKFLGLID